MKILGLTISGIMALSASCTDGVSEKAKDLASADAENGLEIVFDKSPIKMFKDLKASVNHADQVESYEWSITDSEGNDINACKKYNSPTLSCKFELPGEFVVGLKGSNIDGDAIDISKKLDVIDPSELANQAPVLRLDIKDTAGEIAATLATFENEDLGKTVFAQHQKLKFDFSRTEDDRDDIGDLKFSISVSKKKKEIAEKSDQSFPNVGVFLVTLTATDSEGLSSSKSFQAVISCPLGETPPVTIDTSKVAVGDMAGNYYNFFRFDLIDESVASGGKGGPYRYRWDFDGDGIYDTSWLEYANHPINEYAAYAGVKNIAWTNFTQDPLGGMKQVRVKAWDTGCNYFAESAEGDITFGGTHVPMTDGIPETLQGPQLPNHHFLQAKIIGKSNENLNRKMENVDFIATEPYELVAVAGMPVGFPPNITLEKPNGIRHVICDYKKVNQNKGQPKDERFESSKSHFSIDAVSKIKFDTHGKDGASHGMYLSIDNIDDTVGTAAAAAASSFPANTDTVLASKGVLGSLTYYTDYGSDLIKRKKYAKVSCTHDLTVTVKPPGVGTCSTAPDFGYFVEIDGTFHCDSQRSADGLFVEAQHGAFFCQVAKVSACPPGGGGGGGGIAPKPQ